MKTPNHITVKFQNTRKKEYDVSSQREEKGSCTKDQKQNVHEVLNSHTGSQKIMKQFQKKKEKR